MRPEESDAQFIVIDIDSNTILYHSVLDELFRLCVVSPSDAIRKLYTEINPCESKSFCLPKVLPRENFKPYSKHMSVIEKRE